MTTGIVAPQTRGFLAGLSTAFSTGTRHKLEKGALVQEAGAVHVAIHPVGSPSVSTQIAALRHLLLGETSGDVKVWFGKIKKVRLDHVAELHLEFEGAGIDEAGIGRSPAGHRG